MDPQQRVLLEQAWLALADAGIRTDGQSVARTGVFVGASASDYSHKAAILGVPPDRPSLLAQMPSSLAARLGYVFDLKGPALTVDMGCASAVAAIKLAIDALRRGEVEVAVAGAVAVQSTPLLALMADQSEILSADGRCRSFAADAHGLGLSEGAGVVVLKRLSDATAAGDTIHAVLRAASVSQNGATNGMSAPSVSAQVAQARAAFAESGIAPDSVSYVEGHGVGTKAGDSAEIAALAEVFGPQHAVPIGSVKSNIGHSLAAAGMAGLFKVVLQLRHGMLAPSLHAEGGTVPELAATRLTVNTRLVPWTAPSAAPRRAAINSFAINGSNGFMLVEQAPDVAAQRAAVPPAGALLLFAGRSEAALREQLGELAQQLEQTPINLADLACTCNAAPPELSWRAAFVAADAETLSRQLQAAASGAAPSGWCFGEARRRDVETRAVFAALAVQLCGEAIDAASGRAKLLAAAQLFVDGVDFTAPAPRGARRINLVSSRRFARRRYWLGEEESRPAEVSVPVAVEHPGEDRRLAVLREAAAAVLQIPVDQLADDAVLTRLGLDSAARLRVARSPGARVRRGAGTGRPAGSPDDRGACQSPAERRRRATGCFDRAGARGALRTVPADRHPARLLARADLRIRTRRIVPRLLGVRAAGRARRRPPGRCAQSAHRPARHASRGRRRRRRTTRAAVGAALSHRASRLAQRRWRGGARRAPSRDGAGELYARRNGRCSASSPARMASSRASISASTC